MSDDQDVLWGFLRDVVKDLIIMLGVKHYTSYVIGEVTMYPSKDVPAESVVSYLRSKDFTLKNGDFARYGDYYLGMVEEYERKINDHVVTIRVGYSKWRDAEGWKSRVNYVMINVRKPMHTGVISPCPGDARATT